MVYCTPFDSTAPSHQSARRCGSRSSSDASCHALTRCFYTRTPTHTGQCLPLCWQATGTSSNEWLQWCLDLLRSNWQWKNIHHVTTINASMCPHTDRNGYETDPPTHGSLAHNRMGPPAGRGRGVVLHGETRGVVPRMMEDVFRATSLVDVATTEVSVRNTAAGGMCVCVCACVYVAALIR